mmetsp:Transcript_17959/g.58151  ORF Transcript_17959/g.58151 Transcript_17959/m.58151 type:complete len:343 (-) Transcript_17959:94-1122(-)
MAAQSTSLSNSAYLPTNLVCGASKMGRISTGCSATTGKSQLVTSWSTLSSRPARRDANSASREKLRRSRKPAEATTITAVLAPFMAARISLLRHESSSLREGAMRSSSSGEGRRRMWPASSRRGPAMASAALRPVAGLKTMSTLHFSSAVGVKSPRRSHAKASASSAAMLVPPVLGRASDPRLPRLLSAKRASRFEDFFGDFTGEDPLGSLAGGSGILMSRGWPCFPALYCARRASASARSFSASSFSSYRIRALLRSTSRAMRACSGSCNFDISSSDPRRALARRSKSLLALGSLVRILPACQTENIPIPFDAFLMPLALAPDLASFPSPFSRERSPMPGS